MPIAGAGRRRADPPHVPGTDAAGVVDRIGEGVTTGQRVGDHVTAVVVPVGAHGAHAELIVLPPESTAGSCAAASGPVLRRPPAGLPQVAMTGIPGGLRGDRRRLAACAVRPTDTPSDLS
ncbi:alcohol dehydrogenase catalytic domain-containing protein [Streptomyces sp. NPDC060198]|uniref:alcohol dehydrogenase catalytic domain-containing protein n=1 Tax=Streptomyces sp. NPDC060198 TaxID=3347070 RepID=UPI003659E9A6